MGSLLSICSLFFWIYSILFSGFNIFSLLLDLSNLIMMYFNVVFFIILVLESHQFLESVGLYFSSNWKNCWQLSLHIFSIWSLLCLMESSMYVIPLQVVPQFINTLFTFLLCNWFIICSEIPDLPLIPCSVFFISDTIIFNYRSPTLGLFKYLSCLYLTCLVLISQIYRI